MAIVQFHTSDKELLGNLGLASHVVRYKEVPGAIEAVCNCGWSVTPMDSTETFLHISSEMMKANTAEPVFKFGGGE